MIKRTIKETMREYDKDGNMIRETITETHEYDDTICYPQYPICPSQPFPPNPLWGTEPSITRNNTVNDNANDHINVK